jgi:hypothetical protein
MLNIVENNEIEVDTLKGSHVDKAIVQPQVSDRAND